MTSTASFDAKDAQTRIIRSSFVGTIVRDLMTGGLMIMYANHVLELGTAKTSLLAALFPLWLVLRYPFLNRVNALPRFQVLRISRYLQILVVAALMVLPPSAVGFWGLLILSSIFIIAADFLLNAVFIVVVSEITDHAERGRFLGRLRVSLQICGGLFGVGVFFYVGDRMDVVEHKVLLLVGLLFLLNSVFWLRGLTDTPNRKPSPKSDGNFWHILRTAPLLRRPLVLSLISSIWEWPIIVIYLLNSLSMPADTLALFLIVRTLGSICGAPFWGWLVDIIGCRNLYLISFGIALCLYPLTFLLPDFAQIAGDQAAIWRGTAALVVFGALMGLVTSGHNFATTMYQSQYLSTPQGYYALNILTAASRVFLAGLTMVGGTGLALLETRGMGPPRALLDGLIWVDPFRIIMVLAATAILAVGLFVAFGVKPERQ